jgi:hypothetical protein
MGAWGLLSSLGTAEDTLGVRLNSVWVAELREPDKAWREVTKVVEPSRNGNGEALSG